MGFCPVPHKTRDQVWLAVGAATGAAVCWWLFNRGRKRDLPLVNNSRKPQKIDAPRRVVDVPGRSIDEFFGNPSTGTPAISAAYVQVSEVCEEPAQTPEFDEYVLVLEGTMRVTVADDDELEEVVEAKENQALFLPKGRRYVYRFPDGKCRYVPICTPAFSPTNCGRED
eukprot:TRINITY_DN75042_c0_g1_i1.p2 TRINITY_DN75042_c0_g1~~TRINITY_DN75042_c0_g1_i1.p2  ORF type:complete len:189 (-),score=31.14 TRINITY_DN75042_c0_g1_i1:58-564(-)